MCSSLTYQVQVQDWTNGYGLPVPYIQPQWKHMDGKNLCICY